MPFLKEMCEHRPAAHRVVAEEMQLLILVPGFLL